MEWLVWIVLFSCVYEGYKAYLKSTRVPDKLEERLAALEGEVRQLRELLHDAVIAGHEQLPRQTGRMSSEASVDAR